MSLHSGWLVVALIHRYLGGLLDPFVTLLEVHKLMYFMQEAGEPLRLKYVKAPYGPYAENLRHVLRTVEGRLIAGYADGGGAPDKPLTLVPGAIQEASAFLDQHAESRERFACVTRLVEGFESPYGLELLSTVHWVMTHEGGQPTPRRGRPHPRLEPAQAPVHAPTDRHCRQQTDRPRLGAGSDRLKNTSPCMHRQEPS
jgi:hypothetical protein